MKDENIIISSMNDLEKYSSIIHNLAIKEPTREYNLLETDFAGDDSYDSLDEIAVEIHKSELFSNKYYEYAKLEWEEECSIQNKIQLDIYHKFYDLQISLLDWVEAYETNLIDELLNKTKQIENKFENEILYYQFYDYGYEPELFLSLFYQIVENTDFDTKYKYVKREDEIIMSELTEEVIFCIQNNPELLYTINPRLFEELVFKILNKMKMNPILTKQTKDGGYDIIAFDDNLFTKNKYLIECKRYSKRNKISVEFVRQLYGVLSSTDATKAILVTTSSFTSPARLFAERHQWKLELKDFSDIKKWLSHFWKK